MNLYEERFRLKSKDVDLYRRLRCSRLFELLQEASIRHTELLGMGREKTLDRGLLWIVGLQRSEIRRMPEYDEEILLRSWPGKTMRLFFPRYYSLETVDGEELLRASALWSLVDQESRKLVFPDAWGVEIDGQERGDELDASSPPRRLPLSEQVHFTVPYSYVDLNGHMNNTRYFDLAQDLIPAAQEGRRLLTVQTEYVSEARLGDDLSVRWGEDDGRYYLEGTAERCVFRMRMDYDR